MMQLVPSVGQLQHGVSSTTNVGSKGVDVTCVLAPGILVKRGWEEGELSPQQPVRCHHLTGVWGTFSSRAGDMGFPKGGFPEGALLLVGKGPHKPPIAQALAINWNMLGAGPGHGQQPALPVPHDSVGGHRLPGARCQPRCPVRHHAAGCGVLFQGQGTPPHSHNCTEVCSCGDCPHREAFSPVVLHCAEAPLLPSCGL